MNQDKFLKYYRLKHHPFNELQRWGKKLYGKERASNDLEICPEIWCIEGHKEEIRKYFDSCKDSAQKPYFFLLYDSENSGHNYIVNYLIYYFLNIVNNNVKYEIIYSKVDNNDSHEENFILDILDQINKTIKNNLEIKDEEQSQELIKSIRKLLRVDREKIGTIIPDYQEVIDNYVTRRMQHKNQAAIPIFIIDEIKTVSQIKISVKALNWCDQPNLVILKTSQKQAYQRFNKLSEEPNSDFNGYAIELTHLKFEDIDKFIRQCWQACSDSERHPFGDQALKKVFEGSYSWYFQEVMMILDKTLNSHFTEMTGRENDEQILTASDISVLTMLSEAYKYVQDIAQNLRKDLEMYRQQPNFPPTSYSTNRQDDSLSSQARPYPLQPRKLSRDF